MTVTQELGRLRLIVETGIAVSSERSLDVALGRVVAAAALVTDARYAALTVTARGGTALERVATYGLDDETREAIGELPRASSVLGVLVRTARRARLVEPLEGDRPTRPFLGCSVRLAGDAFGKLYVCEKADSAEFDEDDAESVSLLASQAAAAIENARIHASAARWSGQLEALHEIGTALAGELDVPRLLELTVVRLRELLGARLVAIAIPAGDGLRIEAIDGPGCEDLRHQTISRDSKLGRVLERGASETVDALAGDAEAQQQVVRRIEATTGLYVPLVVRGVAIGVLFAADRLGPDPRFDDDDLRLAEQFAERAAVALDRSRRVMRDSMQRVVEAQELERRRIARELHDETGQALASVLLGLQALDDAGSAEALHAASAALRTLVVSTLQGVRQLAFELRPKALDDFGLIAAVERLVREFETTTGVAVELESQLGETRLPEGIETALYRMVQEALTNVARHADARHVSIVLLPRGDTVSAVIDDDGRGFSTDLPHAGGRGLIGMRERVALLGGRLSVESAPGAGTTLAARVPLR